MYIPYTVYVCVVYVVFRAVLCCKATKWKTSSNSWTRFTSTALVHSSPSQYYRKYHVYSFTIKITRPMSTITSFYFELFMFYLYCIKQMCMHILLFVHCNIIVMFFLIGIPLLKYILLWKHLWYSANTKRMQSPDQL